MSRRVWFHLILTTYGSWLPGDPRGFRTRHHREHVQGDYKSPPPTGQYANRHLSSQRLLKEAPTVIAPQFREVIGKALRDRLQQIGSDVLSVACGGQHVHLQVQLDDGDARMPLGIAKKHATFEAHAAGFVGKLWALRPKNIRIRDRTHQANVYRYILNHRRDGAWVWSALIDKEAQG